MGRRVVAPAISRERARRSHVLCVRPVAQAALSARMGAAGAAAAALAEAEQLAARCAAEGCAGGGDGRVRTVSRAAPQQPPHSPWRRRLAVHRL